jgi:STE24 endopeptidase
MLGLAFVWLVGLPFRFVEFWWVKSHGILRTDWFSFVLGDWFALGSQFLAASAEVAVVMGSARLLRRWWPVVALPLLAAIQLGLVLVSPVLVSEDAPLHDARLTAAARRLGRIEGVRGVHVSVEHVKRDTTAPNAEAVGTGNGGHVILWDTLLDGGFTRREVTVVLGHEIGHLKHDDALRGWGFTSLLLLPAALLVVWATRRRGTMREPAAVPVALFVVTVFAIVTLPLTNAFSRRIESSADWTSLQATRDPVAARGLFTRFVPTTLSEPTSPLWAHALFDDHPTELDRIAMADAWARRHGR